MRATADILIISESCHPNIKIHKKDNIFEMLYNKGHNFGLVAMDYGEPTAS